MDSPKAHKDDHRSGSLLVAAPAWIRSLAIRSPTAGSIPHAARQFTNLAYSV